MAAGQKKTSATVVGEPVVIPVESIHVDPALKPKEHPTFMRLLDAAVRGEIPVYFAAIPLGLCVPFDLDYRRDLHDAGGEAIRAVIAAAIERNHFQPLLVYLRGKWFVVADDYIPLFAALEGQPDYVPCWVLGRPEGNLVRDVQGPIALEDVRRISGLG